MVDVDTIVIGAGVAGLSLARRLSEAGAGSVALIEKSRSPGGRLATRRSEYGNFDHGAQYITSRTPEFSALLNRLAQDAAVAPWKPSGKDSARAWWVGRPGMSAVGKALAQGLTIHYQTRAATVRKCDGRFRVQTETAQSAGPEFSAARIVAAIPAPQAQALLEPLDPAFGALSDVQMAPCWTAMLAFDEPLGGVPDLIRIPGNATLNLIARNSSKPERSGETFVMHAGPDWSRHNIYTSREMVAAQLITALRVETGFGADLPPPVHVDLQRWLYALVENPYDALFAANTDNTLFACGDWCVDARVEAAHQSAMALADHLIGL